MAKKKKQEELEEIEDELEDLDDLDDEDEDEDESDEDESDDEDDEDEEDDDDEDEEEEEKPKSKKSKSKKRKARTDGKIGTFELAEALGTDGRNLRVMLRDRGVKVDPESKRYEWASVKTALKEMGFKNEAQAQKALKESRDTRLDALKERAAEARAAKAGSKKKSKAK